MEYISFAKAWNIARDMKRNPDSLGEHLATLFGYLIDAETLRDTNLEHVLALYVKDEDYGEDVSDLLMEYCEISSVAKDEYVQQMEKLREVRDSLYPERPPRDVDQIFKKQKWEPLPYDMTGNNVRQLWNEIPEAVPRVPILRIRKRKAVEDENKKAAKLPRVEIEEHPMEGTEDKRIVLKIKFPKDSDK